MEKNIKKEVKIEVIERLYQIKVSRYIKNNKVNNDIFINNIEKMINTKDSIINSLDK